MGPVQFWHKFAPQVLWVGVFTALYLSTFGYPVPLAAQTINDPRWRNFKQDDGLTSNNSWSILVDGNAIWFGQSNGVTRFDGIWVNYSLDSPLSLLSQSDIISAPSDSSSASGKHNAVTEIPVDIQGDVIALARSLDNTQVWIGTQLGQLSVLHRDQPGWTPIAQLESAITVLHFVDNQLWIGSLSGLYRIDNATTIARELFLDEVSARGLAAQSAIDTAGIDTTVTANCCELVDDTPVYEFFRHEEGLYVGGRDGLQLWQAGAWTPQALPPAAAFADPLEPWCSNSGSLIPDQARTIPLAVHAITVDAASALWIGTPYGAARRTSGSDPVTHCWTLFPTYNPEGEPALVQKLTGNHDGSIWAVTDGGGALLFEEYGQVTLPFGRDIPGNLNTDFVRDVAIDQDGAVWFATPVGVFQYLDRTWHVEPSYAEAVGVVIGEPHIHDIRDLLVDTKGHIWIATAAGIRVKESPTIEHTRFVAESSGLPGNNIFSLAEDRDGAVWAGTEGAGVARFANNQWLIPILAGRLPSPNVTNIVAGADGAVWLGTDAGLAVYHLDTSLAREIPELAGETIKSLAYDSAGRLWVASSRRTEPEKQSATIWRLALDPSSKNLIAIEQESLRSIAQITSLPHEFELNLAADYRFHGGMWLAIDQIGLYNWDGSAWANGDPEAQLPTDFLWSLHSILGSEEVWIGSEGGVTRFDGRTWGTLKDVDGLASPAIWAIAGSPEGGLWFGGRTGLSYYQPDTTAPWVQLSQISGDIHTADAPDSLTLTSGADVDISLTAGDLQTLGEQLKLYYRRVPLLDNGEANLTDAVWQEFDGTIALATDVIGSSRLEFQARDQAFNYSVPLSLPIEILPANVINLTFIGLGKVEQNTFFTLIALSLLAIVGFGYVSLEIVQGRRRAIEAMVRSYNPYVSGEPIRRDDMFFGRYNLLQRIIDTLHNNSIMIHGERRIGKTTMLYQIASRLDDVDDPDYWFIPIYVDLEGTAQDMFFHFLIEEIAQQVYAQYSEDDDIADVLTNLRFHTLADDEYSDREFNRDLRQLVRQLQRYGDESHPGKNLRVILLMDEMDVMSSYDHLVQQQLRRIFMRDFASIMGAVVAGIQISKDWERIESPWYNMFNEIKIEPFTDEQGIELLVEPVKEYYTYDQDALSFIIEHSDGRPFRIQQYGLEVVTTMLAAGRRRIKLEDVLVAHNNIQNSHTHTHRTVGLSSPERTEFNQSMPQGAVVNPNNSEHAQHMKEPIAL